MKQRKFSLHDFAGSSVLSREEMKKIAGGVKLSCPSSCIPDDSGGAGIGCNLNQKCVTLTCGNPPNSSTYSTCV